MRQFAYQDEGISFLRTAGRAILADEPGLGKSRQALLAANEPVLICASATILDVWRSEVERWRPGLDVEYLSYGIMSTKRYAVPSRMPHRTLICDEAHNLKNHKAKRSMNALLLAKRIPKLFLLTGTPIDNWGHEIYNLARLLQPNDPRFTSYWRFIEEWFTSWKPPWGGTQIKGLRSGVSWEDLVKGCDLHERMLRRTREGVRLQLPPMQTLSNLLCPMSREQAAVYNALKTDYFAMLPEGGSVSAWSQAGLHTKLAQAASGLATLDPTSDPRGKGSGKSAQLIELLQEPLATVVFCQFRNSVAAVHQAATKLGLRSAWFHGEVPVPERTRAIRQFQDGDIDVLVCTVESGSEGITLTRADRTIFYERSWRPSKNEQAKMRVHRIGLDHPVTLQHLLTPASIDANMWDLLERKNDQFIRFLSAHEFAKLLG